MTQPACEIEKDGLEVGRPRGARKLRGRAAMKEALRRYCTSRFGTEDLAAPVYYVAMRGFIHGPRALVPGPSPPVTSCRAPTLKVPPCPTNPASPIPSNTATPSGASSSDAPSSTRSCARGGEGGEGSLPQRATGIRTPEGGLRLCAACGQVLFSSDDKFESGHWLAELHREPGRSHPCRGGQRRHAAGCGAPRSAAAAAAATWGHVFDDGPKPTGLRYCMNSAALKLQETAAK